MLKKQDLRTQAIKARQDKRFRPQSVLITQKLKNTFVYNSSQNVMLFHPLRYEVNILSILKDKKNFCFPCIRDDKIIPFCCGDNFCCGKYNIQEPLNTEPQNPLSLDLVIVPSLYTDEQGYRIGYGKGYYDRFIKTLNREKTKILTVIYDEFIIPEFEHDIFDEKVDFIVSEKRVIEI